jgi:hypothetical protein
MTNILPLVRRDPADKISRLRTIVDQLDRLERRSDVASWEKATCCIDGYESLRRDYPQHHGLGFAEEGFVLNQASRGKLENWDCKRLQFERRPCRHASGILAFSFRSAALALGLRAEV